MNLVIEVNDVFVNYGATPVLRGLSLQLRAGEIYALLGGNGAGKSTTINVLLGFVQPAAGSAAVCGIDVRRDPLAARARLAYVPENVALYEHLTARENLSYFLHLAGANDDAIVPALETVGLAREAWDRRLGGFSKGMRQKTAIALALARAVPVLLLDEPTTGLDPKATAEFNAMLASLRQRGVAVLMVTHDLPGAAAVADHIGYLDQGRIARTVSANASAGAPAGGGAQRFAPDELYRYYHGTQEAA